MSLESEYIGAQHLNRVLDLTFSAMDQRSPRSPIPCDAIALDIEFDSHFAATIIFTMEGERHAATETSPGEAPQPRVISCRLQCGAWSEVVPFEQLAAEVRQRVLDECAEEAGWR